MEISRVLKLFGLFARDIALKICGANRNSSGSQAESNLVVQRKFMKPKTTTTTTTTSFIPVLYDLRNHWIVIERDFNINMT